MQHFYGVCVVTLLLAVVEMVVYMRHPEFTELKAEVVVVAFLCFYNKKSCHEMPVPMFQGVLSYAWQFEEVTAVRPTQHAYGHTKQKNQMSKPSRRSSGFC